jgi:hypothetical protein
MPMKIEPWPGGRWYRDLGDNDGHLWRHVQAIKQPTLLEIYGPLMMSYPVSGSDERESRNQVFAAGGRQRSKTEQCVQRVRRMQRSHWQA